MKFWFSKKNAAKAANYATAMGCTDLTALLIQTGRGRRGELRLYKRSESFAACIYILAPQFLFQETVKV